jgi:hypothetical protein
MGILGNYGSGYSIRRTAYLGFAERWAEVNGFLWALLCQLQKQMSKARVTRSLYTRQAQSITAAAKCNKVLS